MGVIRNLNQRMDAIDRELESLKRFCEEVEVVVEAQNEALETLKLPLWRRLLQPRTIVVKRLVRRGANSTPGSTVVGR